MNSKLMAIDLAKNVFQVCVIGVHGQVLSNRRISRHKLSELIANTPPTIIAMEACSSAHFWGRLAHKHGHEARLLPPQHVKAFRGVQKSDGHDALAIGEAAQRPKLHSVPVKDIQQQDLALMVQVRARMKRERTALTNQIRGFAAEYGLSFPKGIAALLSALPHIPVESDMHSAQTSRLLAELGLDLIRLSERLDAVEAQMLEQARVYPAFARLQQIPGVGPIIAATLIGLVGSAEQFENGRQMSAWVGLVPRQRGTGGRVHLGHITKVGDRRLRTQLIHGSRSVLRWIDKQHPAFRQWAQGIIERRGEKRAIVAYANKLTRLAFVALRRNEPFDIAKAFQAPQLNHPILLTQEPRPYPTHCW